MLSRLIRESLYLILHTVISLLIFVKKVGFVCLRFKKYFSRNKYSNYTELLKVNSSELKKRPIHLVLIFDEQYFTIKDLANIVIWCLLSGVPFISFYDRKGKLKKDETKLFKQVESLKRGIPGCIKWSNQQLLNGYSNGHKPFTTTVHLFTGDDGHNVLTNFTKDIALGKISWKFNNIQSLEEMDILLRRYYPCIPDPDLAVYSGYKCCSEGLLPWQLRLTEFLQLNSYNSLNVEHFISVLRRFSKCDQRFGK